MSTEQMRQTEELVQAEIAAKKPVFTQTAALAVAKSVEGLRAVFEEVSKPPIFLSTHPYQASSTILLQFDYSLLKPRCIQILCA